MAVDLFVHYPIPYQEMLQGSVVVDLDGIEVRVCSIDDLFTMKQQAGRHKDLADIEQLTKIKEFEKDR